MRIRQLYSTSNGCFESELSLGWANVIVRYRHELISTILTGLLRNTMALVCLASGWTLEHSETNLLNSCLKWKRALKAHIQFLSCSSYRSDRCGSESVFWGTPRDMSDHSEMSSHLHLSWGLQSQGAVHTTDNFRPLSWLSHPNDASLKQLEILHICPSLLSEPLLQLGQPASIGDMIRDAKFSKKCSFRFSLVMTPCNLLCGY